MIAFGGVSHIFLAEIADKMPGALGMTLTAIILAIACAGIALANRKAGWLLLILTAAIGGLYSFGVIHELLFEDSIRDAIWQELGWPWVIAGVVGPVLPTAAVICVLFIRRPTGMKSVLPRSKITLPALAAVITFASLGCCGTRALLPAPKPPYTVAEVRERGVQGLLGVPLGTMVIVSGKSVPNPSNRKADEGDPFVLQITTVDGKPLTTPVQYPFRLVHDSLSLEISAPKDGEAFEFRGFESGGYVGVPDNFNPTWQAMEGFLFFTQFYVLPRK